MHGTGYTRKTAASKALKGIDMTRIHFFRELTSGVQTLLLHKLRSFLTMLGVVFGVGSVMAMLAVGEGASQEALEWFEVIPRESLGTYSHPGGYGK